MSSQRAGTIRRPSHRDYDDMEDDELVTRARNWEALARYGFHPYMHNPQLKRWLPSIKARTLVLWGAIRRRGQACLWRGLREADSRRALRSYRQRRASSRDRAARSACRARREAFLKCACRRASEEQQTPWTSGTSAKSRIPTCRRMCSIARRRCARACPTATATRRWPPISSRNASTNSCWPMSWA